MTKVGTQRFLDFRTKPSPSTLNTPSVIVEGSGTASKSKLNPFGAVKATPVLVVWSKVRYASGVNEMELGYPEVSISDPLWNVKFTNGAEERTL